LGEYALQEAHLLGAMEQLMLWFKCRVSDLFVVNAQKQIGQVKFEDITDE